jgi:2-keto-4-pentenoate hydratase/2-oxohepta-3-ene-1,7-dioic acid hydratase in catechol pathway
MRVCLFATGTGTSVGAYDENGVVDLTGLALLAGEAPPREPLDLLGPGPVSVRRRQAFEKLIQGIGRGSKRHAALIHNPDEVELRAPIPRPNKLLLLAGNYADHIMEGGGQAPERLETFPYVFMKPASTAINHPGAPIKLPAVSPDHVDWEVELGVVMGRTCRGIEPADALNYVAGYTVVNDVSDREYKPNPNRKTRESDDFFDWLHGKWHDGFAPVGPCITPTDEIGDVQKLGLSTRVNGHLEPDSNTSHMIFSVADTISFISQSVTLERGDIIATGTPAGVGAGKNKYLRSGDRVEVTIDKIGSLANYVIA